MQLLSIGIPVVMLLVGLVWDSLRQGRRRQSVMSSLALEIAAVASAAAALIHFDVVPEHAEESALYAAFFVVCGLAQLASVWLLLVRRWRWLISLVALGNAAVVLLWLFTRLVEVPIGPAAGEAEAFGALDVAASVLEVVIVIGCALALRAAVLATRRQAVPAGAP